jgi:WD40 repeat protein
LKNIFDSDITCMDFDHSHRKLVVGNHLGQVKVFDLLSGIMTHQLEGHDPGDGEISFIGYGNEDNTIITAGWDRFIKIHSDETSEHKDPKQNVLRGKSNCHKKDIVSGAYSHNLGLIASGSRDNSVRIWDYEKIKLEAELLGHTSEVVILKFLNPFPLLLSADNSGQLYVWLTKPHP